MKERTLAQKIMISCGADPMVVLMGSRLRGKISSNTKKGPGRVHLNGKKEEK